MKIELMKAAAIGALITKVVKNAQAFSDELHLAAVQCALQVREHGDTSLAQRLCDELKNVTSVNVQGLRKWFGDACPMTARGETWKLMDKASETYDKYLARMIEATTDEAHEIGQPDANSGPGSRIFFVDWAADNPFWTDGDVQASQRGNIRVMGVKGVLGLAFAIRTRYEKSVKDGTFGGDMGTAQEFIDSIVKLTSDFEKKHAADLIGEDRVLTAFKAKLEEPPVIVQEVKAAAEVGGDVATGINTSELGSEVEPEAASVANG